MNISSIQPDGPTVVVEGQPYGEQPVHITPSVSCNDSQAEKKAGETNGDRWRRMTDREIAEYIFRNGACRLCPYEKDGSCVWDANNQDECIEGLTKWAGSEAE